MLPHLCLMKTNAMRITFCAHVMRQLLSVSLQIQYVSLQIHAVSLQIQYISLQIQSLVLQIQSVILQIQSVSLQIQAVSLQIQAVSLQIRIALIRFAFHAWSERGLRAECVPNPFHYHPTNPLPPPCLPPLSSPLSGCPPFADFPGVCTAGSSPGCFRSLLFAEHGAAISRGTSKRG